MTTTSGMPGDDTGSSTVCRKRGFGGVQILLKPHPLGADRGGAVERRMPSRRTTRILAALALGLSVIVGLAGPRDDGRGGRGRLVGAVAGTGVASADVVPVPVPTTLPPLTATTLPTVTTLPGVTVPGVTVPGVTVPGVTVPGVTTPTTLPTTTLPTLPGGLSGLPVPTTLPTLPGLPPLPLLPSGPGALTPAPAPKSGTPAATGGSTPLQPPNGSTVTGSPAPATGAAPSVGRVPRPGQPGSAGFTPITLGDQRPVGAPLIGAAGQAARTMAFPIVIGLLILGFLMVQSRIDARDPRLAWAPLDGSDDTVGFTP